MYYYVYIFNKNIYHGQIGIEISIEMTVFTFFYNNTIPAGGSGEGGGGGKAQTAGCPKIPGGGKGAGIRFFVDISLAVNKF